MPFTQDFARSLVGAALILAIVVVLSVASRHSATLAALPSALSEGGR